MIRITIRNSHCERAWMARDRSNTYTDRAQQWIFWCFMCSWNISERDTRKEDANKVADSASRFANQPKQWQKFSTEIDRNKINNASTTSSTIPPLAAQCKGNNNNAQREQRHICAAVVLDFYSLRLTLFCFCVSALFSAFVLVFYVFSSNRAIVSKSDAEKKMKCERALVCSRIEHRPATVSLNTPSNTTYHEQSNRKRMHRRDSAMHADNKPNGRETEQKVRAEHCTIREKSQHKSHSRHVANV